MFWLYLYLGIGLFLAIVFDLLLVWMLIKNEKENRKLGGDDIGFHEILGIIALLAGSLIGMTLFWIFVVMFLMYIYGRVLLVDIFWHKLTKGDGK
jgi:hypothetical protein